MMKKHVDIIIRHSTFVRNLLAERKIFGSYVKPILRIEESSLVLSVLRKKQQALESETAFLIVEGVNDAEPFVNKYDFEQKHDGYLVCFDSFNCSLYKNREQIFKRHIWPEFVTGKKRYLFGDSWSITSDQYNALHKKIMDYKSYPNLQDSFGWVRFILGSVPNEGLKSSLEDCTPNLAKMTKYKVGPVSEFRYPSM